MVCVDHGTHGTIIPSGVPGSTKIVLKERVLRILLERVLEAVFRLTKITLRIINSSKVVVARGQVLIPIPNLPIDTLGFCEPVKEVMSGPQSVVNFGLQLDFADVFIRSYRRFVIRRVESLVPHRDVIGLLRRDCLGQ